ncbi:MAG: hypothetical protein WA840_03580 [Caulobacteraceae bacterium]
MARAGVKIPPISDIDTKFDDPVRRFEVLKARVGRWDALWSIQLRKRETRGKIIIGGAVLAAIAEVADDDAEEQAFRTRILALLDERVPRVRDRLVVRQLLAVDDGQPVELALRPGGPLDESLVDALKALGEGLSPLERSALGGWGGLDHDSGEEADLEHLVSGADHQEGNVQNSDGAAPSQRA